MEPLPSFAHPPVVETAIAIQFPPLKGLKNVHLWAFWSSLREDYPETQDQEPIEPRLERYGEEVRKGSMRLPRLLLRPHASRLQAISPDDHAMVQVQNGRFIFNWRRLHDGEYPRWTTTINEFQRRFGEFRRFLKDEGLGEVEPDQWEVTYVNHMLKGQEWQSREDWGRLLPGILGSPSCVAAGSLEALELKCQHLLPDERGRLYIECNSGYLTHDLEQELLVLTLTTRGEASGDRPADEGLEIGHRAIVTSFKQITSTEAHRLWGIES